MKIYFAGSIRGGRQDQALYLEIIKLLQNYGEVFTEHIGDSKITHMGQVEFKVEEIFKKDIAWLEGSDVIIAEVTVPSLGVGYELGYASKIGKKIIALYRPGPDRSLSAMVQGDKNIQVFEYQEISELQSFFDKILV